VVAKVSDTLGGLQLLSSGRHPIAPRAIMPTEQHRPLGGRHLLVVGLDYAPDPIGIAPYTTGMAEHLAARAASVTVLTGQARSASPALPAGDGAPTVLRLRHHVPARPGTLGGARRQTGFVAAALTAAPARRPDLVVAVTPGLAGALAGVRIARRHGVPLVIVVHGLSTPAGLGVAGPLERYALRGADQVVVVSEALRSGVRACGVPDERITLLPDWSPVSAPAPTRDRTLARRALGWAADAFIVAHTGTMSLKQDLDSVVAAARRLPGQADFVFVGDGSQRLDIEAQAAGLPNVRFVDRLSDARYPLALTAADLLLVNERPSAGDLPLPRKLASYLSAGRPVLAAVASNGATAAELARARGAGLVVRPRDPGMLAEAVLALKSDPLLRAAMGRAGLDYSRSRLRRDSAMQVLDGVVDGLVGDLVGDRTASSPGVRHKATARR
jgi:glycosyltransferase involved in cell wall biosynthesis